MWLLQVEVEDRLVDPIDEPGHGDPGLEHEVDQVVMGEPFDVRDALVHQARAIVEIDPLQLRERMALLQGSA
jgi:hypothetical protein